MADVPTAENVRITSIDVARSISAIGVVWLHVAAGVVNVEASCANPRWWVGNVADSLSRWCVPVFVMVSGAVLIPRARQQHPWSFIKKRLPRIVFLTAAWTALYGLLTLQNESLATLAKQIILGRPYYHLWFMYMLIGLYFMAPFLQRLVESLDAQALGILVAACFLLSGPAEILAVLYPAPSLFTTQFLPYIGYFCIGPALATQHSPVSCSRLLGAALLLGATIAVLTGALLPWFGPRAIAIMYGYQNPLVALMSFAVFAAIFKLPGLDGLAKYAPLTLGVYLIHPAVLRVASHFGIDGFLFGPVVGIPLVTCMATVVSAWCVYAIKTIPVLRRLC